MELKNISAGMQQLKDWELSIVRIDENAELVDRDIVDLPEYEIASGEILLLVKEDPWATPITAGDNAMYVEKRERLGAASYVIDSRLNLPNTGRFMLLLRDKYDKNGKDENIQDYAGNGFFEDTSNRISTQFWPRIGQYRPLASSIAPFGDNTFGSRDRAWQRIRYQANDGHHRDAWEAVGAIGGLGYDPHADLLISPGTPGYENTALRAGKDVLVNGEVSISEIMYDRGPNGNAAQWIELYNSSLTDAVNLNGWELRIRNLLDGKRRYIDGVITLDDAVILPNQTLLIVVRNRVTNVYDNRIYDLYVRHRSDPIKLQRSDILLNPMGFYLKLTDKGDPLLISDNIVVDEVDNIAPQGVRTPEWALPQTGGDRRRSIVRLYGTLFTPEQNGFDGEPDPPEDGRTEEAWRLFPKDGLAWKFYGLQDDLSSPRLSERRGDRSLCN